MIERKIEKGKINNNKINTNVNGSLSKKNNNNNILEIANISILPPKQPEDQISFNNSSLEL